MQALLRPRPVPGGAVSGVWADPSASGRGAVRPLLPALAVVLTSRQELGPQPWDAGHLRQFLTGRHRVALRVAEFLTDEGVARANPRAALEQWLARRLAVLPEPFAAEVRIWTEALHGHGPRAGRPRHPRTIEAYLRVLETPLATWSARYSLREVTTEDLTAQLEQLTGATRQLAMAAMRSLSPRSRPAGSCSPTPPRR